MVEATVGTRREYAERVRQECLVMYPGLTETEYDDAYPPESRQGEWEWAIDEAARAGKVIPARVLDDLWHYSRDAYRQLLRDYPNAIPDGYLPPDARKHNREHEAEMRTARRAGRLRAKEVLPPGTGGG